MLANGDEKDARHEVVVGLLKTNQLNKVRRKNAR